MKSRQMLAVAVTMFLLATLVTADFEPGLVPFIGDFFDLFGADSMQKAVLSSLVWLIFIFAPLGGLFFITRRAGTRAPAARPAVERNKLGVALSEQGAYVAAIAEFSEALRLEPGMVIAAVNRGASYWHLDRFDEALADLDAAVRLGPTVADAFAWRGHVLLKKGEYDRALADYDQALRLKPAHGEVLAHRALIWVHRGDLGRALGDYNLAMACGCSGPIHRAARGDIFLARGEHDDAVNDYTEAIKGGMATAHVIRQRGLAWFFKGEYARAVADYDEALRLEPADGLAYNNRGAAFIKTGEYARAAADLAEAARLAPKLPHVYKNLAWLQATCPEPEFRDGAQAAINANRGLELAKEKVPAWLGILAAAHAEAGNFEEAVRWQAKCIEESPAEERAELQARLELYRAGQPYREQPAISAAGQG